MNTEDSKRFKEILTMISEQYGYEFAASTTKLWWNLFKQYPIESFEQAVYAHISCPDAGMFTPKPGNITKFITGNTKQVEQAVDDKAEMAWQVIEGQIRRIGSWGTLKMEDKQALAAVKALGGWKYLCSLSTEKLIWCQKEFVAAYKNYERAPLESLPQNLPGRVELENHKKENHGKGIGFKQVLDGIKQRRGES